MDFRSYYEHEVLGYPFQISKIDQALKFVPILISVDKLDALLGPDQKIGPGGTGPNVKGIPDGQNAYSAFGQFAQTGVPIEMPTVDFDRNKVYLINGRHRFAWMRDQGAKQIWVAVRKNKVNKANQLLV